MRALLPPKPSGNYALRGHGARYSLVTLVYNVHFIVGEKGTGKTAYAVYITNTAYNNNLASTRYIRETDYLKFISLKSTHQLDLSDYVDVWKVVIYLLLSEQVLSREKSKLSLPHFSSINRLKRAIDEYYSRAFSPEITYALRLLERVNVAAGIFVKHASVESNAAKDTEISETRYQTNLLYIQRRFEDALRAAKLSRDHILFIDGIDVRPQSVPYDEYLSCIKGLANAVWSVNNDFFGVIKDSPGRLRAVLLVRPDIFQVLGLQNPNTKIRDNSAILDWRTNEGSYRTSELFQVVNRLLAAKKSSDERVEQGWDYYFSTQSINAPDQPEEDQQFSQLLRLSLHRPRDFVTMLGILKEQVVSAGDKNKRRFTRSDTHSLEFRNRVSEYLLGEIRDHILFYYTDRDYEMFLKFFEYLYGKPQFRYAEYERAFERLGVYIKQQGLKVRPEFMESPVAFLQFLYDLNVVCYVEKGELGRRYVRWCFRERSYSNMAPKVKLHEEYWIHLGLRKVLNLGEELRGGEDEISGRVKWYSKHKNFGFLVSEIDGSDVFFHIAAVRDVREANLVTGAKVFYELGEDDRGRVCAVEVRREPKSIVK